MPPKAKFTREEIIDAALDIVRQKGIEGITARALANKLGSSACPIFTVFRGLDEVQEQVIKAAKELYREYIKVGLAQNPAFKGVGMQYILFSQKEPRLFCLLFMSKQAQKPMLENILPIIEDSYDEILQSVMSTYTLDRKDAEWLYRHLWIYTHGIAALCATDTCVFSPEDISTMLTEVLSSLMNRIKGELS